MKWTKPRSKETPKELRRLKPGSVPSKMLILERKKIQKKKGKTCHRMNQVLNKIKRLKLITYRKYFSNY